MEYYYTEKENVGEDKLVIKGDEAGHLKRVLRKEKGDEIFVTDGERNLYRTRILKADKDSIECEILERKYNVNEPDLRITLFQSLLKNPARFEFVIEKATELGVHRIVPVISEHVVNKKTNKQERWQSIALAAMKQSQRCFLPEVNQAMKFEDALSEAGEFDLKLIAHEKDSKNLTGFPNLSGLSSICIFIGPEGGFSENELKKALDNGFKILNLGKRKLRSETAAIVILGILYSSDDSKSSDE